jgi:hypothetical protein
MSETWPVEQLRFVPETHEYFLGSVKLPSVTGILDGVGLISSFSKNEDAALRGIYVHLAARYLLEKRLDWGTLGPLVMGYVVSLDRWIEQTHFELEACEVSVYHALLLFAGTYDFKGFLPGYGDCLFDIKTSAACASWHHLQTAGYLLAEGGYRKRGCLHLQGDGTIARFHEHQSNAADRANFVSCLNVYRLKEAV